MALMKETTVAAFGELLTFPHAYIVLTNIVGNKKLLTAEITTYKDNSKEVVLDIKRVEFTPSEIDNSERWDKQIYEYLKTTAEYENCIDC